MQYSPNALHTMNAKNKTNTIEDCIFEQLPKITVAPYRMPLKLYRNSEFDES